MSTLNPYMTYQPASLPGFLQGPYAQNFAAACGYGKDIFVELAVEGVQQRFINVCSNETLSYHGSERGLPMYVGDTYDSYRARLLSSWDLWTLAGTAQGILINLGYAGFNHVQIQENFQYGSDPTQWFKFKVIIDDTFDHLFGGISFYIGDGTLIGDGHLIGFTRNPPNEAAIKTIINKWKPAHTLLDEIVLILDGWTIGGIDLNGNPLLIGGTDATDTGPLNIGAITVQL